MNQRPHSRFQHPCIAEAIADQLSSPLASYEFDNDNHIFHHHDSYPSRLRAAKTEINQMRDRFDAMEQTTIEWETRSRLAQSLNDMYSSLVPQGAYFRLKKAGYGYLPLTLSTRAICKVEEPSSWLLDVIDEEELDRYVRKMRALESQGLCDDITLVWNAIPIVSRNLMITMWITRSRFRNGIAHPVPTVEEGLQVVCSDPGLAEDLKNLAETLIPVAATKNNVLLFAKP